MWQVPIVAMTLTGGLWYAVISVEHVNPHARAAILAFSAIANIVFCVMIHRVRSVFGEYLCKIRSFNEASFVDSTGNGGKCMFLRDRVVVKGFGILLVIAAVMSAVAAIMAWTGGLRAAP